MASLASSQSCSGFDLGAALHRLRGADAAAPQAGSPDVTPITEAASRPALVPPARPAGASPIATIALPAAAKPTQAEIGQLWDQALARIQPHTGPINASGFSHPDAGPARSVSLAEAKADLSSKVGDFWAKVLIKHKGASNVPRSDQPPPMVPPSQVDAGRNAFWQEALAKLAKNAVGAGFGR